MAHFISHGKILSAKNASSNYFTVVVEHLTSKHIVEEFFVFWNECCCLGGEIMIW
jgi:hypothetical protein